MVLQAVEFYSGIGGLHRALRSATVPASVVRAFDWDQTACRVYEANHGPDIVRKTDIATLSASDLSPLNAQLWLLSPSCQPYTVLNPSAKDAADPRAKSFLHLIQNVLPDLVAQERAPKWVLVENVAGFETSVTRQALLRTLKANGYDTVELLLTPLQFGIPNSRLRYYLLAKARPLSFPHTQSYLGSAKSSHGLWRHIPGKGSPWVDCRDNFSSKDNLSITNVRCYLDTEIVSNAEHPYRVPDRVLEKWGRLFDIVLPSARRTCCFTRGYTQMVERTGSVLQMNEALDTTGVFNSFLAAQAWRNTHPASAIGFPQDSQPVTILHPLRLRYFTPTELLALFHFIPPAHQHGNGSAPPQPSDEAHKDSLEGAFHWPPETSLRSKYKLIGNSVNVEVVRVLVEYLFEGDELYVNY